MRENKKEEEKGGEEMEKTRYRRKTKRGSGRKGSKEGAETDGEGRSSMTELTKQYFLQVLYIF